MATASAATQAYGGMAGILLKANYPDLLDTSFKAIVDYDWNIPVQAMEYFNQMSTTRDSEKFSSVEGFGLVPKNNDEENLATDHIYQGFDTEITPVTMRLAAKVTARLRKTDQHGKIAKIQKMLAKAPRYTVQYLLADAFNTGFTSAAQWTCADGMYLFDSGRPNAVPGVTAWSNLDTGAMTADTLADMRVNFRKHKSGRGLVAPMVMTNLIVPPALEDKAKELTQSSKSPEDSLNRINVNQGMKYQVLDFLNSDTAWFGYAANAPVDNELYLLWLTKPTASSYVDGQNDDIFWHKVKMEVQTGCGIPHVFRGSTGA